MDANDVVRANEVRPGSLNAALEQHVADVLGRIPERWEKFTLDALSERESEALCLLVSAALVERRCRIRLRTHNDPQVVEATYTTTGMYGPAEALAPLVAFVWEDWQAVIVAWAKGETTDVLPFHCERIEPSEWRLTANGEEAKQDLAEGRASAVFDFVLRQGLFDGEPHTMPGGEIVQHGFVRGHGRLEKYDKKASDLPAAVTLANWSEGAAVFAATFRQMFESMQVEANASPEVAPPTDDEAATNASPQRFAGRKLATEDRLQRYLRDFKTDYERAVDALRRSDSRALHRFKKKFGPTAIARHFAKETGGDEAEVERIKNAVQNTRTYRERIKPVIGGRVPRDFSTGEAIGDERKKEMDETLEAMRRRGGAK